MEKEYLYWLCQIPVLGAVKIRKLWEYCGNFKSIYNIEEKYLTEAGFLTQADITCIQKYKGCIEKNIEEYHSLEQRGIQFITPLDENYPKRLRYLYDMPMGLYLKGRLPEETKPTAAIIGARACTNYGYEIARLMGKALSKNGIQIISGLAAGIDGAGHWGAVNAFEEWGSAAGRTAGVLGCGITECYPKENFGLYDRMTKIGGIISEYSLGEKPIPRNFPMRNRIISGLSDVVIVVEAKEKSGSLITVGLALEQGKEIFALPGRITDPLSKGCNDLIKEGANILTNPCEVSEYFGLKNEKILRVREKSIKGLAKKDKMVYSCLDLQPKHIDEIVSTSRLPLSQCLSILLELEVEGFVVQTAGQYYGKRL